MLEVSNHSDEPDFEANIEGDKTPGSEEIVHDGDFDESMTYNSQNDDNNPASCNICGEGINIEEGLSDHISKKHHNNEQQQLSDNSKECNSCNNYKEVEQYMEKALDDKQKCIEKIGKSLNKLAHEKGH